MAHQIIVPSDEDRYYEADSIDIPFTFNEHNGETPTPINLTGMTVEFRVKDALTDPDAEAHVTKIGTEGGVATEVTFPDATAGKAMVHIQTDDTDGVLSDGGGRDELRTLKWHVRVIDSEGRRVTSEAGDWEIHAS